MISTSECISETEFCDKKVVEYPGDGDDGDD